MVEVQAAMSTVTTLQTAFATLVSLSLTSDSFPKDVATDDLQSIYDNIVIGGGTAGCVLGTRLSEDPDNSVIIFEAGGLPPIESLFAGLFPIQVGTDSDWRVNSKEVDYSGQNLIDKVVALEQGHVLGGTSTINHMVYTRSVLHDFLRWVNVTGDDSWSYENLLPYYKKYENVRDENLVKNNASYYGTDGPLYLNTQHSSQNIPILEALNELNNCTLDRTCSNGYHSFEEPLLTLHNGVRYTASMAYSSPYVNRTNLSVKYFTKVIRILFDSNNKATGVEIMDSNNTTRLIKAKKEIIVSAGAMNSPKVLILSGIGPKDTLDNLGIKVVADLPVGQKLKDRPCAIAVYTLGNENITTDVSYRQFPVPISIAYIGLNSSDYPHYQAINLVFSKNSPGLPQVLMSVLQYNENISQEICNYNVNHNLLVALISEIQPYSEGEVTINSTDSKDDPIVDLKLLSDYRDSDILGQSIMHFSTIRDTPYFKNLSSEMLHLNLTNCNDLDKTTLEYYTCYGKEMSTGIKYLSSTCAMGSVLRSDLSVINTTNLYVVDSSAIPFPTSGNLQSTVYLVAEKAADMIKAAHNG